MDTTYYLQEGAQTKITADIKNLAESLSGTPLNTLFDILTWMHKHIKLAQDNEYKNQWFRKRTAGEIIKSGTATGCTDYALAFITLARAKNIPAKYIEAVRTDWLETKDFDHIEGHVFAEIFLDDAWRIIDPQAAQMHAWYGKQYKIVATGLDSWDIGITDLQTLREKFTDFTKTIKATDAS